MSNLVVDVAISAEKSQKKVVKKKKSSVKKKVAKKKTKKAKKKTVKRKRSVKNKNTFKGDDYYNVELVKKAVARDWKGAESQIRKVKNKSFAKNLLKLTQIYYKPEELRLDDILSFFQKNSWIPVEPFLFGIEKKLDFSKESNSSILEWFDTNKPITKEGKFILIDALVDNDEVDINNKEEVKYIRAIWRKTSFNSIFLEERFLKKYKSVLKVNDLNRKIEILTFEKKLSLADKIISVLPKRLQSLPKERLLVAKKYSSDSIRIQKAYKKHPHDPYFQYLYIKALQKRGKEKEAIKTLLKVKPTFCHQKWWRLKNLAIRDAIKHKMYRAAYSLTIDHNLPYGSDMAEAEWLGGWISLRFLNNPSIALKHFDNLYKETRFASSKSKASYWIARSYEAMGDSNNARSWYIRASSFKGTFYGNMAIAQNFGNEKINYFKHQKEDDSSWYNYIDKEKAKMITHLAAILHEARVYRLVDKLFYSVSEMDLHHKDLNIYVNMLESWKKKSLAVKFSRVLSNRKGELLLRDGYPYKVLITKNKLPKPVYLGIIRQESNFDQHAVSSAGARGLMQLMPGTARRMAKKFNIKQKDYAHNPKTNVLYGVKYIDHLYDNYNNLPMAIAAYNAGPGNVKKWVGIYGDPRKLKSTYEIIDWIESIPYSETRSYVKSVLENTAIYDSILSKKHKSDSIIGFLS